MDNWIEIVGFPNYYINKQKQIKHFDKIYKDNLLVTLRNSCGQLTIRRNRLLVLAVAGVNPLSTKGIGVDIIEINGELRAISRKERCAILAQEKHKRSVRTKEEAIIELDKTIEFCEAIKTALDGNCAPLLEMLEQRKYKLIEYLKRQGIKQDLAEDISISVIEWYFDAITVRRCTATSFDYLKKRAMGIYKEFKATHAGRLF